MRPVEFTSESIIQAGQHLQAAGRNITGFALRQTVGGGSPNRLRQVWEAHQSSQARATAEPVAELPQDLAEVVASVSRALTERLVALAVELNDRAVKAAERRVHDVVHRADEQRVQAERELADAADTVDDLETKLDEAQTKAETLDAQLAEVQASRQAQAVELAQLRERGALSEQASQVAAAELDLLRVAGVTVKAQAAAAEQVQHEQRKTLAAQAQRATERQAEAEAQRDAAREHARTAREDGARLAGKLEALQTQVASLLQALTERQAPPA